MVGNAYRVDQMYYWDTFGYRRHSHHAAIWLQVVESDSLDAAIWIQKAVTGRRELLGQSLE